ncbi:MAG: lysylphosphatidylglycerol synthase transmembrane domain-containing protein [Chloroflexota bacterium]
MTSGKEQPKPNTRRQRIITLLKLGVTLGGLYLVISKFDPALIVQAVTEADLRWMAVGFVLIAASLVVRSWRWQVILKGSGATISFPRLVELYFVGTFFNAFLPSGFGGDFVRAAEAAQNIPATVAVSSVVIDRLSGLMALFIMALAILPFRPPDFPPTLLWLIIVISVTGLLTGLIFVDGRIATWVIDRLPQKVQDIGGGILPQTVEAVDRCTWRALGTALLISMLFNLMQVGWWYTTGLALSLTVPLSHYVLVVPLMSLALLFPSVGGLGVRETLAPALFGNIVPPEQAVALTLLVFGLERLASLLGGPVYIYATLRDAKARQGQKPYNKFSASLLNGRRLRFRWGKCDFQHPILQLAARRFTLGEHSR